MQIESTKEQVEGDARERYSYPLSTASRGRGRDTTGLTY